MTWITDNTGTRWVEVPQPNRRKSPRALRFADLKVGDQIMKKPTEKFYRKIPIYYVVTDLWFDPVEGQDDALKGSMVGYSQIRQDGHLARKSSTTLRGLASNQFTYADVDYLALCKARSEGFENGSVVGIGKGVAIRNRPKLPGSSL